MATVPESFGTAMNAVTAGKYMRRTKWANGEYIGLIATNEKGTIVRKVFVLNGDKIKKEYVPTQEDLVAVDWVELESAGEAYSSSSTTYYRYVPPCNMNCWLCPYYTKRYYPIVPYYWNDNTPYIWSNSKTTYDSISELLKSTASTTCSLNNVSKEE